MNPSQQQLEDLLPKIEIVDISVPQLNPNNPRTITEKKFKQLVQSIETFWQMLLLRPLVLNDNDEVLGGNMRLQAARAAGLLFVPVIRAINLTELQQREFIVKDNLPFGDWNFDQLANEWSQDLLKDWGLQIPGLAPLPPLPSYNPGGDDIGDETKPKKKTQETGDGVSFNILVKCSDAEDRDRIQAILEAEGLVLHDNFYHI